MKFGLAGLFKGASGWTFDVHSRHSTLRAQGFYQDVSLYQITDVGIFIPVDVCNKRALEAARQPKVAVVPNVQEDEAIVYPAERQIIA
jgi:hypothetical protein